MFDPIDFFHLAKELINEDEASIRTSIGRAYYASFLITRDKLGLRLRVPDVHHKVIESLYGVDPLIANKLHSLRRLRNSSDYDLHVSLRTADAERALKLADAVISGIR